MVYRYEANTNLMNTSRYRLVVGMDVAPEMIAFCRDRHLPGNQDLQFEVADAGDPSTMKAHWEAQFDLLVSFTAMHWVPDQRKVLQCVKFCLKSDGVALLLLPMKAPTAFITSRSRTRDERGLVIFLRFP